MLIVETEPPLLKSLRMSRSPGLWTPTNLPVAGSRVTLFWKNQKPCCASPLLSKRSEPKKRTSQLVAVPGALQVVAFFGIEYLAAKASWRLSLSGRPPSWSFHCHPVRVSGSLEPPPVKMVAFCEPSLAQATAVLLASRLPALAHWSGMEAVVSLVMVTALQTESQSSKGAVLVTALPSSSMRLSSWTAWADGARKSAPEKASAADATMTVALRRDVVTRCPDEGFPRDTF